MSLIEVPRSGLDHALERLEAILTRAIASRGDQAVDGAHVPIHPVSADRTESELKLGRHAVDHDIGDALDQSRDDTRLLWLRSTFALSPLDLDIVLVALAPELESRFERIYSSLQGDFTQLAPTVDLVLRLFAAGAGRRIECRRRFAPAAPLIRNRIIELVGDPSRAYTPIASRCLVVDSQIVRMLTGDPGIDPRLSPYAHMLEPVIARTAGAQRPLQSLVELLTKRKEGVPLRIQLSGDGAAARRKLVQAAASSVGSPLLILDFAAIPPDRVADVIRIAVREAWFQEALLYVEGWDILQEPGRERDRLAALAVTAADQGVTVLGGDAQGAVTEASAGLAATTVALQPPDAAERAEAWRSALADLRAAWEEDDLVGVAERFQLDRSEIAEAAASAAASIPDERVSADALRAAARTRARRQLGHLGRRHESSFGWDDLVLIDESAAQLRDLCARIVLRERVFDDWGFAQRVVARGTSALFCGPPGTGKTMAAGVVARELGVDLVVIDLAGIVSKYIGETSKNLDRIFSLADRGNSVLFFDEADALFGKRSEVRDSHDRYANIEVAHLLQRMEAYDGLAILATNLRANLDDAFTRRLSFVVHFPFPEARERRRIWERAFTDVVPLDADIDFDELAERFPLSGGNIRNAALTAAFLAAPECGAVRRDHVLAGIRAENLKLGGRDSGEKP